MLLQKLFPARVQWAIPVARGKGNFACFEGSGGLKNGFQLEIIDGRIAIFFSVVTWSVTCVGV